MRYRYSVYDIDHLFASVHAASAEDAITSACAKVLNHDPNGCTAHLTGSGGPVLTRRGRVSFALEPGVAKWQTLRT